MKVVVMKFGGTSLYPRHMDRIPPEFLHEIEGDEFFGLKRAVEHVRREIEEGTRPVVVVSAMGRKAFPYATDTLLSLLDGLSSSMGVARDRLSPRERDLLLCCGEIISASLVAQALKLSGIEAVALTGGQAGIVTDESFGEARILAVEPERIWRLIYEEEKVPVVAGFQGMTRRGDLTTIGRGGSDTTAVALGAALMPLVEQEGGSIRVDIYTDVEGVMTADPKIVGEAARVLKEVTYEELSEMAHSGAAVIHERAAEVALQHRVPLRIRGMFSDSEGTIVKASSSQVPEEQWGVRAVTCSRQALTFFRVWLEEVEDKLGAEKRIYEAMANANISIFFVGISRHTTDFAVRVEFTERVEDILKALLDSEFPKARLETITDCCTVSVVGPNLKEVWGVMERIAEALFGRRIKVVQFADSPYSTSCLVPLKQAEEAVRALHEAFELDRAS